MKTPHPFDLGCGESVYNILPGKINAACEVQGCLLPKVSAIRER